MQIECYGRPKITFAQSFSSYTPPNPHVKTPKKMTSQKSLATLGSAMMELFRTSAPAKGVVYLAYSF